MHSFEDSNKKSEIQKIVHLLHSSEETMEYLNSHTHEQLTDLRLKITHAILEEQSETWEPLAKVTKFMPNFLNAKVSEDILGPSITANITYHVPPKEAISIANYFSTKFFCDVLEHVIPEKVEPIIRESNADLIRKAVHELRKRKNYYLIGALIDYTPMQHIHKISMEVDNPDMVLILEFITKRERMSELLDLYIDTKILGLIRASVDMNKMDDLLDVFSLTTGKTREKVIGLIKNKLEDSYREKYREPAKEYDILF
ncbi:MAG: hypothetical protein H7A24_14080 [Leptospiraceae bacterium]|nr:hypothetical protein [Leptospiraceae bacterium]MCP5513009.1 hypothetical protein [Leptospiraceae bacterium]